MIESRVFASEIVDSKKAIKDILGQLQAATKISPPPPSPRACILFASIEYNHQLVLDEIYAAFPDILLIGGTTDGEIAGDQFYEGSLVATFIYADEKVGLDIVYVTDMSQENTREKVTNSLLPVLKNLKKELKVVFSLTNGLLLDNNVVVEAANSAITSVGANAVFMGGATADDWKFSKCIEFANNKVLPVASSVFLLISGDVQIASGFHRGWSPIGEKATVTESQGNILISINNIPALDYVNNYLKASGNIDGTLLVNFPIACYVSENEYFMRTLIHPDGKKIICAGSVPQGIQIRLSQTTTSAILESTHSSCETVKKSCNFQPTMGLIMTCTTRKHFLGTQADLEAKEISKIFGNISLSGMYCYGEVSPLSEKNKSFFHNNTLTLLLMA